MFVVSLLTGTFFSSITKLSLFRYQITIIKLNIFLFETMSS